MIEHSPDITELAKALVAVQGEVDGVKKDSVNPHFKNRYASLESVIDTARPALQRNGIAFTQAPGAMVDGAIEVTTMLVHASGQWMRSTVHMPLSKRDAQGAGSAITYGCRYSLMAALGLPPVDDDGEEASKPAPQKQPAPRQERPKHSVLYFELEEAITGTESMEALNALLKERDRDIHILPEDQQADLRRVYAVKREALRVFA